jgi:solute carrier family 10 (sodium/bile acid cotransporter), member 7
MKTLLSRLRIDPYIASILGMVALASALPAEGRGMVLASAAAR